jgi:hypothetical protein
MSGGIRAERRRKRCAVLVAVLLLACQLALTQHVFGATHPHGELCQVCAQFYGSGHAPPPADLPQLAQAIGPAHAVEVLCGVVVSRPIRTVQARAPPLS